MKKQIIVVSPSKHSYINAASTEKMLDAFETKLTEMQSSVESSVKVNSSVTLTDEQRDLLWDVIDQYNTSHPVSGRWEDETAHEQQTIADTFGISLADAKQIMIDELGFDPNLEGHMEGDHWAEEDLNSATEVTCASFTPEQEDLLWKIDDRYEGDVADEDIPGIIAQIQKDIMSELGVDAKTAKRAMVDVLLYDPEMVYTDVESSTDIKAADDSFVELQVYGDDGYHYYEDIDGIYSGVPGAMITVAELKNFWNDFYDDDPVLNEEYSRDEGQKWLNDTLGYMKEVESCDSVNASNALHTGRDENTWYIDTNGHFTGHPGEKVSRADLIDYWNENLGDDPSLEGDLEGWLSHTIEFMEPADSNADEIDEDLDPIKGEDDEVYQCSDSTVDDVDSCGDVTVEGSVLDPYYFGKEAAEKYGDLISDTLSGQTVSKRQDLAEEPGGLIYEANLLGIDMWDLLEALEGMCYQGRAMEIDDSTYRINGQSDITTASDTSTDTSDYIVYYEVMYGGEREEDYYIVTDCKDENEAKKKFLATRAAYGVTPVITGVDPYNHN